MHAPGCHAPLFDVIYVEGSDFHLRTKPPLTHSIQNVTSRMASPFWPAKPTTSQRVRSLDIHFNVARNAAILHCRCCSWNSACQGLNLVGA
jgi:hypothetical protein